MIDPVLYVDPTDVPVPVASGEVEAASSDEEGPAGGPDHPRCARSFQSTGDSLNRSMAPGVADVVGGEGAEDIIDGILQRKIRAVSLMQQSDLPASAAATPPTAPADPVSGLSAQPDAAAADAPAAAAAEDAQEEEEDAAGEAERFRQDWKRRKKHMFIFSDASRPVFSRYGDEQQFTDFFGMMRLLLSLAEQSVTRSCPAVEAAAAAAVRQSRTGAAADSGAQEMRFVHAGGSTYVFYRPIIGDQPGPLFFAACARTGETVRQLRMQLHLLSLVISTVLTETVYKIFAERAGYDLRSLLGGTDVMFRGAIRAANHSTAFALEAVPVFPLKRTARDRLLKVLRDRVREADDDEKPACQFALLLYHYGSQDAAGDCPYGGRGGCNSTLLLCAASRDESTITPLDFLLMCNFTRASMPTHSKHQERWAPFCMPEYCAEGYMYLYCTFLSPSVSLVLLSSRQDAFARFNAAKEAIASDFLLPASGSAPPISDPRSGPLAEVTKAAHGYGVGSVEVMDKAGLRASNDVLYFAYKDCSLEQLTSTVYAPPFVSPTVQKQLLRTFVKARERAATCQGTKKTWVVADQHYAALSRVGKGYEILIAFKPMTAKASISFWTTTLKKWVRARSDEVFASFGSLD